MTDILAWLAANWLILTICLAFLLFLIIGTAWAVSWYFWRLVIEAEREPAPLGAYGDSPHLPPDYWQAVARKEAKRRVA